MNFFDRLKIIPSLILLLTVILPSSVTAFADTAEAGGGITVFLSDDGENINVTCSAESDSQFLVLISPDGEQKPIQALTKGDNSITLRCESEKYLYSKYAVCTKENGSFTPSHEAYITNFDTRAKNTQGLNVPFSKKGLNIRLMSDAQLLGVSHTVIDTAVNELITSDTSSAYSVVIDGKTYHFDTSYVNTLDHKIKVLADSDVNIYMQLVLSSPSKTISEAGKKLYYSSSSDDAKYYAVSLKDTEACENYYAALKFLASRYTDESRKYGFVGNYIIGNTVNSNRYGNYAGQISLSEYVSDYSTVFRTSYAAIKSTYSNALIYTSVNNCFNSPSHGSTPDPSLDYTARDFLTSFNENISSSGNLIWHLCAELYNVDTDTPAFWQEDLTSSYDTPYITMKNVDTLTSFINDGEFSCGELSRRLTVSACAFSADDNTAEKQTQQAASYALAYCIAEANNEIDAFIYSSHVDLKEDVCKNAGLYTRREDTFQLADEQKEIYSVFKYIDTSSAQNYISKYSELIESFSKEQGISTDVSEKRIIFSKKESKASNRRTVHLFDFDNGVNGFYPSDNAYSVAAKNIDGKEKHLYCVTYNTDICEYRGICRTLSDISLDGCGYVSFDITPTAPAGVEYVDVMCRLWGRTKDGKSTTFEGTSQIPSEGKTKLTYNISDFIESSEGEIYGMKIWIKPYSDKAGGEYEMCLSDISFLSSSPSLSSFFIVLLIIIVSVGCAVFILYLFKRKRMPDEYQSFERRKLK